MSKINLHLDFDEIRERIDTDKAKHKPAEWAKLLGVSKNVVTNIHGATHQKPSIEYIIAVARATGKPIEWYLYGNAISERHFQMVAERDIKYEPGSRPDFMCDWPEEIKDACRQLKEILLSDHHVIKPALLSNLAAFQYSIDKEKSQDEEIRKLSRRLEDLEEYHKAKQGTGTGVAASSSTGRKKT